MDELRVNTRSIARVGLLLGAALAIKIAVLVQLGSHPLLQPHGELDTATYVDIARATAQNGPLAVRESLYVSPLYIYFLALVFKAGGTLMTARVIQIALGTTTILLLYLTARHWFGTRSAVLAAMMASATGLFTFYEVLILQAALDPFLTACTLYLVTRAVADERWWQPAAAGISAALFALNRPNTLVYALAVAGFLLWAGRRDAHRDNPLPPSRRTLVRTAIYVAALLLVLAPNAIRNYVVSGEAIPVASHGGLNFYIGNNAAADGRYQPVPGVTPSIVGQIRDSRGVAEADLRRPLTDGEVSEYFYRRAWGWIESNPWKALKLFTWKLVLVLNRTNLPLNYSYAYYAHEERTLLSVLVIGPWLLIPLGIAGLFISTSRLNRRGFWMWGAFIPLYAVSVAAFFVSSRYRMPLLVPLCATSAAAIVWMFDRLRERQVARLLAPAILIGSTGLITYWNTHFDDGRGGEQRRKAVWLIEQGQYAEAERYVDSIAARHSHPAVLQFRVGEALAAARRFDEAIEHYRKAIEIDREQPAAQLALGQVLVLQDRSAEAVAPLRAAFEARFRPDVAAAWLTRALMLSGQDDEAIAFLMRVPEEIATASADVAFDLGSLGLQLGVPAPAERWLQAAVRGMPARADAHEQLGVARLLLARHDEAITPLEEACRLDPSSASAHLNLAVAYAQNGQIDAARGAALQARRLDPAEPRTAALLKALPTSTKR